MGHLCKPNVLSMCSELSVFFRKIQWLCSTLKFSIFVFCYQERLDGPDTEKSRVAVDYLALADLWEHFAESSAYGLAVLVRLLGHVLPLRHPAIHSHQPHHLQATKWF